MVELILPWPPSVKRCAGIYRIDDLKSGCFYIGSAVDLRRRFEHHLYCFVRGIHHNNRMQKVWNKDSSRLRISVLIEMPGANRTERLMAEQLELDKSNVGSNRKCFNVLAVAGSHEGAKRSEKTKLKLSKAMKGREFSDETRMKMSLAKIGKTLSEERKKRLKEAFIGRKISRPMGIINRNLRSLTDASLKELRRLRECGLSWSKLAKQADMDLAACRRAILGITYKDVK